MARSGFSTSNYLSVGSAVVTAVPLTMAAWFYPNTSPSGTLVAITNNGSGTNRNCWRLSTSSGVLTVVAADATSADQLATVASVTVGAWNHGCVVCAADNDRRLYLNGGNKVTTTNSRVPSGVNRTAIGVSLFTSPFSSPDANIGEAAIWNVALTDADVAALAKGVSPLLVRPSALVAYFPLVGNNSPENNLKSNSATMSITGALTKTAHPRILMPRRRLLAA